MGEGGERVGGVGGGREGGSMRINFQPEFHLAPVIVSCVNCV